MLSKECPGHRECWPRIRVQHSLKVSLQNHDDKNYNFTAFLSLTIKFECQSGFTVVGISWRVLRVLDGWRPAAVAPWPGQVSSSSSSSLTSPLRIERSAIEQRLSWAPPLLDYPPNTCQLSIEQRDNDISAKHCISLWAGIWGFQCASIRCTCPSKYIYMMAGGSIVFMKDLSNMFKLVGWFSVYNIIKESSL